jgi:Tol biopolymer transport system component
MGKWENGRKRKFYIYLFYLFHHFLAHSLPRFFSFFSHSSFFLCALILIQIGCSEKRDLNNAKKLARSGNYELAVTQFASIISKQPQNSEAHYELGLIYDQQKERDKAISEFQTAQKIKPEDPRIALALARELFVNGDEKSAVQQFLHLLERHSDAWIVHQIAGLTGDAYAVSKLTNTEFDDYSPIFSPNEDRIAFVSFRGNAELYEMDFSGTIRSRLTHTYNQNESSPSYAPKGDIMAFDSNENVNREAGLMIQSSGSIISDSQIRLLDVRGKREIGSWKDIFGRNPSFSPDGKKVVYEHSENGNLDIHLIDVSRGQKIRLTNNRGDDSNPAFSPDGKKVIFVSSRDGNHEIYLMNLDGSAQQRLTYNEYGDYTPAFSSDGKQFVFVSDFSGDLELFLVDNDGGNRVQLTNNTGVSLQPKFSPDGNKIVFVSDRSDFFDIYIMDLKKPVSKEELIERLSKLIF